MAKRVLTEFGFAPFKEDESESEKALKRAGMTRSEMEIKRAHTRLGNRKGETSMVAAQVANHMTDEQLEKELKERKAKRKNTTVPIEAILPVKSTNPLEKGGVITEPVEDYSKMTNAELKGLLDDKGIMYAPSANKAKLLDLLAKDGVVGEPEEAGENEDESGL